jgi:hypothetical protein
MTVTDLPITTTSTIASTRPEMAADPVATRSPRFRLLLTGAASGLVAAGAVVGTAAVCRAADVSFAIDGKQIPLLGFAQITFVSALLGAALAALLRRRSTTPRRPFLATTIGFTAVSLVLPFLVNAKLSTAIALVITHLVAGAVVIPALARALPPTGTP